MGVEVVVRASGREAQRLLAHLDTGVSLEDIVLDAKLKLPPNFVVGPDTDGEAYMTVSVRGPEHRYRITLNLGNDPQALRTLAEMLAETADILEERQGGG